MLSNVADCSETEAEFNSNILPVLPLVCNMILDRDADEKRIEKLSLILNRVSASFLHFAESIDVKKLTGFYD